MSLQPPGDEAAATVVRLEDLLARTPLIVELDVRSVAEEGDVSAERRFVEGVALLGALGVGAVLCRVDPRGAGSWQLLRAAQDGAPGMLLGALWVRSAEELVRARQAGCAFAISPGLTFGLHEAAEREEAQPEGVWLLPLVETLSEAFSVMEAEWSCVAVDSSSRAERIVDALPEVACVVRCDASATAVAATLAAGALAVVVPVDVEALAGGDVANVAELVAAAAGVDEDGSAR